MDKIDGELRKNKKCVIKKNKKCLPLSHLGLPKAGDFNLINGLYIQLIFAIAMYQDKLKLSHNDLHASNMFIEFVTKKTIYNNQTLHDADWYHYHCKGYDLYFPAIPIIMKIGDYGLSVKYSEPIVGDKSVFEDGLDQNDGNGPWIPNTFMPSYDCLFATVAYATMIDPLISQGNIGNFLTRCIRFMCPDTGSHPIVTMQLLDQLEYIELEKGIRPVFKNLKNVRTSLDLLKGPILVECGEKPRAGKIVTIGKL